MGIVSGVVGGVVSWWEVGWVVTWWVVREMVSCCLVVGGLVSCCLGSWCDGNLLGCW